jgi:ABC-type nitrate/sulfonate/bicarbonate transport system substrate-binding protein
MMKRLGQRQRLSPVILAGALILGLSLSAAGASSAAAMTRSNFASSITGESMACVWIARDRGLFRKHDLDVQYIHMSRSPLSIAALLAGEIDMTIIGPGHLLSAATGGADLVGVANFFQKLDYTLNGRPELKKATDIRGKRIAISGPGATSHIVALLALKKLGIDPNEAKISFITIPGTELNRRLALETGSVDATVLRGSIGELYTGKGYPPLFNFKGSGITMPQTMVVTTRRAISGKPQLVEGYLKALIEAIAYIMEPANKETVARTFASNLRLSNPSDVEEAYQSIVNSYERVPYPTIEGMKTLQNVMIMINPKLANVNVERAVDASFIDKLQKSGFIQSLAKKP